jgi:hypothetical protein
MSFRWTRREAILKTLLAAGGAIAAKVSGLIPEVGFVTQAASPISPEALPFFYRKPAHQEVITGAEHDAVVARVSSSRDFDEVFGQLKRKVIDLKGLQPMAVRTVLEDGTEFTGVAASIDEKHVAVHYELAVAPSAGPRSHAFVFALTSDKSAEMIAASADGKKMRRSNDPEHLAPNTALADGGCPWCEYPCGPVCCGYNWWGLADCCGAPCAIACIFGSPVACVACIFLLCAYCIARNCNSWCTNCCRYWYC